MPLALPASLRDEIGTKTGPSAIYIFRVEMFPRCGVHETESGSNGLSSSENPVARDRNSLDRGASRSENECGHQIVARNLQNLGRAETQSEKIARAAGLDLTRSKTETSRP